MPTAAVVIALGRIKKANTEKGFENAKLAAVLVIRQGRPASAMIIAVLACVV